MRCPSCLQRIHRGAALCPHCDFDLAVADEMFGEPPVVRKLDDRAGLLRAPDREQVGLAMEEFERRFPDLGFAVSSAIPWGVGDVRTWGFWLLNRAQWEDLDPERRSGTVLLSIDPNERRAGLVWGYALDPFLRDKDAFLVLSRCHAYWLEHRWADGMVKGLEQLTRVLARRAQQAKRRARRGEDLSPNRERGRA